MYQRVCLTIAIMLAAVSFAFADTGDIRHIISHDKTKVVTDPTKGVNDYPAWVLFPSKGVSYRRILLNITYQCPDSQHCGEWDYVDNVFLRRIGSTENPPVNFEIARTISPYGWRFGPTWHFTWSVDITDFAILLRDSVEVVFEHGGYESNTDRGWLITIDFEMTEGLPAYYTLGFDTLWQGSFPYGDTAKPFDSLVKPLSFHNRFGGDIARLRILQTGHGMDDSENCAEFCSKWRKIYLDDSLVAQREIWRRCGENALYPQSGTWIYDRANWCPGSMVAPDYYDLPILPYTTHTVRLQMQPYQNLKTPTAQYRISAVLFYCSAPVAANDATIERIIAPSPDDEHLRMNPVCADPIIRVKNSGSAELRTLEIKYGLSDQPLRTYAWVGRIASLQSADIRLPGLVSPTPGKGQFKVILVSPNGRSDEYRHDNIDSSAVTLPPVYSSPLILALRSNHDSTQTSYRLTTESGVVVKERLVGTLAAETVYYDTLALPDGCYRLVVSDSGGDGLDFWANPDGGYGYARLLDKQGRLVRAFGSDFGSSIDYWFSISKDAPPALATDTLPLVTPFPMRNRGTFTVAVFQNDPRDIRLWIVGGDANKEDSSKVLFDQKYPKVKEQFLPVDISAQPDGFYYVKVTSAGTTVTRKIKVKHEG